jgi:hypothetical protein
VAGQGHWSGALGAVACVALLGALTWTLIHRRVA